MSIITPSFNQEQFIERTIQSVLFQDYPDIEYIVVDGGSTDNTLTILNNYTDRIKWFSEPDEGQADALNKGFRMARGDILGWLNADDTYNPGTVSRVVGQFLSYPEIVMTYGDAYFIDKEGRIIGQYPTELFHLQRLSEACFICQPSVFVRAEVFGEVGPLDANLRTCMDYDYWIRIGKHYGSNRISYLRGEFLANSRIYDEIKTFRMRETMYAEIMATVKKHFGYIPWTWIYGYTHDILIKGKRKRYERYGLLITPLSLFHLLLLLLRNWRGWRYSYKYLGNHLKSLSECIMSLMK